MPSWLSYLSLAGIGESLYAGKPKLLQLAILYMEEYPCLYALSFVHWPRFP